MTDSKKIDLKCVVCGEPFQAYLSELKHHAKKYCSKPCAGHAKRMKNKTPMFHEDMDEFFNGDIS
jgi:hypothetical protein